MNQRKWVRNLLLWGHRTARAALGEQCPSGRSKQTMTRYVRTQKIMVKVGQVWRWQVHSKPTPSGGFSRSRVSRVKGSKRGSYQKAWEQKIYKTHSPPHYIRRHQLGIYEDLVIRAGSNRMLLMSKYDAIGFSRLQVNYSQKLKLSCECSVNGSQWVDKIAERWVKLSSFLKEVCNHHDSVCQKYAEHATALHGCIQDRQPLESKPLCKFHMRGN